MSGKAGWPSPTRRVMMEYGVAQGMPGPPHVAGPAQLPDLRLWLRDAWQPGRPYYVNASAQMAAREPVRYTDPLASARSHASWEQRHLAECALWWVAEPMVDLVTAAAPGIPDDTALADLTPPTPSGLVVFARPWWGTDSDTGKAIQVDAMLWGGTRLPDGRTGLSLASYRLVDFDAGLTGTELGLAVASGAIAYARPEEVPTPEPGTPGYLDLSIDPKTGEVYDVLAPTSEHSAHGTLASEWGHGQHSIGTVRLHGHAWVPLGRSDWLDGDQLGQAPYPDTSAAALASYTEDRRLVAALWGILAQEAVAQRTLHLPERAVTRRHQRAGLARDLAPVHVIRLRPVRHVHADAPEPPTGSARREWSCQWIVSGHWRLARVGKGRMERRLVYVSPHVKGPDGAELRVRPTVRSLVR